MQQNIDEDLNDPGLYVLVDEEDILESLKLDHCYGVYHEGKLVAFTMMIGNRVSERNYGTYLSYSPEKQKGCVSLEISIVDRDYRGFGLQQFFIRLREEEAVRHGARESLVTVGPDNEYSLNNLCRAGYGIISTGPLYEGAVRHILRKKLLTE